MTKEETKEAIKVMQKYCDGAIIQYRQLGTKDWVKCSGNYPIWDWGRCDYRIKPEPRYRPYASAEEMDAAIKEHGLVIKNKNTETRSIITWWNDEKPCASISSMDNYKELIDYFTWLDGSPCGVKEEE